VTGGCGFIGSAVVRHILAQGGTHVVTLDALTYAANRASLAGLPAGHGFEEGDVRDLARLRDVFARHDPDAILHLAAEGHVDRSIDGPAAFVDTNVVGTVRLLEAAREYWRALPADRRAAFRFVQVSTDEVFGSQGETRQANRDSRYRPTNPYAATKAGADHLVRAWHHTYGLPVIVAHGANTYGPRQFPEKLVPLTILNGLEGKPLGVYGSGAQVRDWLHVEDHASALWAVLTRGRVGESYAIPGGCERTTLQVVEAICEALDALNPAGRPHRRLIAFVADRPGHDFRYAMDGGAIRDALGWTPRRGFADGLRDTVRWYLDNPDWWRPLREGVYGGERLGVIR